MGNRRLAGRALPSISSLEIMPPHSAGAAEDPRAEQENLIPAGDTSSGEDPRWLGGSRAALRGSSARASRRALRRAGRRRAGAKESSAAENAATCLAEPEGLFTYRKQRMSEGPMLIFTFLNCCVGVGLLSLPRIAAVCGYFLAAVYEIVSISFCTWAFCCLAEANYHGNFRTAHELAERLYGKAWGWAVDLSIMCCLMPIPYVSVTADYLREGIMELAKLEVLKQTLWVNVFKAGASLLVIFPLTLLRTISAFNTISSFAVIFVLLALIALVVRFGQWNATGMVNGLAHPAPPVPLEPVGSHWADIISYFPVFLALLSVHASVTPIQHELGGTPRQRLRSVKIALLVAIPVVSAIYILAAVIGSLMFNVECSEATDETVPGECIELNSNVLLSFSNDTFMCVVKLLYSIVVIASVPVLVYPIRGNIMSWFKLDVNTRKGYLWYVFIGFVIMLVSTVLSIAIPGIDQVISLISSIGGVILYMLFLSFTVYKLPLLRQNSVGDSIERAISAAVEEREREQGRRELRENARKQSAQISRVLRDGASGRGIDSATPLEQRLEYIPAGSLPETLNLVDFRLSSSRASARAFLPSSTDAAQGPNLRELPSRAGGTREEGTSGDNPDTDSDSALGYAMTGKSIIPGDEGEDFPTPSRSGILEFTKQAGLARQILTSQTPSSGRTRSQSGKEGKSASFHSLNEKEGSAQRRHSYTTRPGQKLPNTFSASGSPSLGGAESSELDTKYDMRTDDKGVCSIKFAHAQPEYFKEPFKPALWRRVLFYGSAALMAGVSAMALVCNIIIMFS